MWRWLGRLLLHLVYFATLGRFVANRLFAALFAFLLRAGMQISRNALWEHNLWVALVIGWIVGVTPRSVLLASFGYLNSRPQQQLRDNRKWRDPQLWVWVPGSLAMVYGVCAWAAKVTTNTSVLVPSHVPVVFDLIRHFFTESGPTISDFSREKMWVFFDQTIYTGTWLGSLGYSAAALIPRGLRRGNDMMNEVEGEAAHNEHSTTGQNQ
jgi:hypothetical protein